MDVEGLALAGQLQVSQEPGAQRRGVRRALFLREKMTMLWLDKEVLDGVELRADYGSTSMQGGYGRITSLRTPLASTAEATQRQGLIGPLTKT